MIHLVDDKNLVSYFLFVEESMQVWHKNKKFFKTLPEGNNDSHFVRAPCGVINRGGLSL